MAGVFNTLRERFAWVLLVFILGGILLFVFSDVITKLTTVFGGSRTTVGFIYGQEIDYRTFSQQYNQALDAAQQQGQPNNEALRRQVWEQTWQRVLSEQITAREFKNLGIDITNDHLDRLIFTDTPPAYVRQIFANPQTGAYDPSILQAYRAQAQNDPNLQASLDEAAQYIFENRRQELYQKGLTVLNLISKPRARQQLSFDRDRRSVQYLAVSYATIADSSVAVTPQDLERYYRANKAKYQQEKPEAMLNYVLFEKKATRADTLKARESLTKLAQEFAATTDDSLYAASKTSLTEPARFVPLASLDDSTRARVAGKPAGALVGPYLEGSFWKLQKVSAFRDDSLNSVKIRHIYLPFGATAADTLRAKAKADSLAKAATTDNFTGLVSQFSEDNQTRFSGGELGWVRRGQFGADFDKTASETPLGRFTAVESRFGYHVIEVQAKERKLVRLATISAEIYPSQESIDALRQKAAELDTKFTELGDFNEAVRALGYDLRVSPAIRPDNLQVTGLNESTALAAWALSETQGARTAVRDLENAIIVGYVAIKLEAGTKPLNQVETEVRLGALNAKKARQILQKLGAVTELEGGKTAYGEGAFVSRATDIIYSNGFIAGIGNDPKVIGAVFGLPTRQLSQPIEGQNGVYVVLPTEAFPAEVPDAQVASTQSRLQNQLQAQLQGRLRLALEKHARVEDYRYRFAY